MDIADGCWPIRLRVNQFHPATQVWSPGEPDQNWRERPRSARGARHNWLTIDRCSGWRWATRQLLTGTSHVHERRASRNRCTHRQRSTHRHGRAYRGTHGHRRTHRYRSTDRHRRGHRHRRSRGNGPGQRHRNTSHLREWSAGRTTRTRSRRCTNGLARRRLDACVVAAGYQRDGPDLWAHPYRDAA
jgi:hypothetical protein